MFTFIELDPFARAREAMLDDSEFARLQMHLLTQPEAGDVIPGSDGCRKLRWALSGRGKRGGARVIYFLRLKSGEIVLVTMCAKSVRDNIDPKLLRELRRHYEKNCNT
jgi:putative component of toxin-antitoxin plasmid stabilization module